MINGLTQIQTELKSPKKNFNNFGKYSYRSAEDILTDVKPLLAKHNCQLTISDDIMAVGDRIYVKAIATITDTEGNTETVTAFAREPLDKKGMDSAQVTGCASSYARKYALNGLFLIDDTKDADSDAYRQQEDADLYSREWLQIHGTERITAKEVNNLKVACERSGKSLEKALTACKVRKAEDITYVQYMALIGQCA